MTPEETWSGSKPSVKHLRVFGCLCFKHVLDQLRRKLDKKAEQMIMLGYPCTGGYRLYDYSSKKVVISSDATFDESRSLNWKSTTAESDSRQEDLRIEVDGPDLESANEIKDAEHEALVQVNQNQGEAVDSRSKRTRIPSSRLQDFEVYTDDSVADDGVLLPCEEVHVVLFADVEPLSFAQAVKEKKWWKQ